MCPGAVSAAALANNRRIPRAMKIRSERIESIQLTHQLMTLQVWKNKHSEFMTQESAHSCPPMLQPQWRLLSGVACSSCGHQRQKFVTVTESIRTRVRQEETPTIICDLCGKAKRLLSKADRWQSTRVSKERAERSFGRLHFCRQERTKSQRMKDRSRECRQKSGGTASEQQPKREVTSRCSVFSSRPKIGGCPAHGVRGRSFPNRPCQAY